MYAEPLKENLVDEVTRLIGRPLPVVREAMSRLLAVAVGALTPETTERLAPFPLTAWQALASENVVTREIWSAMLSAGLTTEEVFTALAVVDDHVRRRFGNGAWLSVSEWGPRLAKEYEIEVPRRSSAVVSCTEVGVGATV
ncbi:MAG: hypothetical protein OEQ13_08770 [Acidobacteriota bacterium]|nr:hypothetical protein [Acidobacteriota bacterium]